MEIGTEEIPAGYLHDAEEFIRSNFTAFLKAERLKAEEIKTTSTPRRLALSVKGMEVRQKDLDTIKTGPAKRIAYNPDGSIAPALEGFLRSNNAKPKDVFWQDNGKGEAACLRLHSIGLPAEQLLPDWITALIKAVPFPKKMKWGEGGLEFARPIRWLVCLWGEEVLPVEINGIKSGRISYGNRFAGLDAKIEIPAPSEYFSSLRKVFVIADRQERLNSIKTQLQFIFPTSAYRVDLEEELLQTVTDLVEYPTAVTAEFEEKFLALPELIITSTISTNQKYFAVKDMNGKLTNKFIFISNGNPAFNNLIRKGNEKVIKPRLEDAMWYYQEDTKKSLEQYVPLLEEVVFQTKLGTMKAKTNRIMEIARHLSSLLHFSENEIASVSRTALLCKADLVTKMLGEKEFTKLQGYIGMHYALASGEKEEVAKGIYEHYLPRGQNDALPSTLNGAIVAVADKLDTVCGIIGIGMIPTGSADPFALRRAANGIVQIIADRAWDLDLKEAVKFALSLFSQQEINTSSNLEIILNYFHQRINWYLQQLQIDYDVIDSVMHIDFGNLLHLIERAKAVQAFKSDADFVKLVIGFKRVSNIIKAEERNLTIDASLFQEEAERALYQALQELEKKVERKLEQLDYTGVLRELVEIRADIDRFFDDVLVNSDDLNLRQNRYALLQKIRKAFLKVADLSLLVVEGK
ncbi:MAG: glycine--tRNA ligase subunit beta [Candidatus Cloacimonadaceae bacterium]